ncbi:HAMP domain-containing protein [Cobetia sp. 4B]|uniref:ATP-binding protein n=1 Tax=Cobetia sp. 4B TaxID=2758724 RepID=UPI001C054A10|nr:ATP-binding protein [Cobetia sp. 4B]MBR9754881.1 HAMP domain-containing protein [Gammaproteobacteria bacterium]QWN37272.1 HAMP domain-containing protein [Cobetia sp. 4B]
MRRALSDSIFLRVYVALLVALVLTLGIALGGFQLTNMVRLEAYQTRLGAAPMRLLVSQIAATPEAERGAFLKRTARLLDGRLLLAPAAVFDLSWWEQRRLEAGRPLVRPHDDAGWQLLMAVPGEERVLEFRLLHLAERQLRGLMVSLHDTLQPMNAEQRSDLLAQLQQASGLSFALLPDIPQNLDAQQASRLEAGRVVLNVASHGQAMALYTRLGDRAMLKVGPIRGFETTPPALIIAMILAVISLLGGVIYLVVRSLEARLTRLEKAATRIAGGYLDTRVRIESNDFLGRLGMAFNGMAERVQGLLGAQQDMIRAVSHELRTPVARIRFALQMIEDMVDDDFVQRQIKGADGDIEELDKLIDEILTYARLNNAAGIQLDLGMVDCREIAEQVCETLAPLHPELLLSIEGEALEVEAEARYLQRALQNLVSNACRHADSRVLVRITSDPQVVRLDVEDDGPGINEEDRKKVFKPFARLDDSRTRASGGYGLGLSIVQKILHSHGGSVVVDKGRSLKGARFSLLLPLTSSQLERKAPVPLPPVKPPSLQDEHAT